MRDEQLTSYALGEVTDAEAIEVEAYLVENPDVAAFVDEVRADALMLTQALQAEPDLPAVSDSYRMQEYVMEPKQERKLNASALAIAATVTLMVVGFLATRGGEFQGATVAMNETRPTSLLDALDPEVAAEIRRLTAERGQDADSMPDDYVRGIAPYVEEKLELDRRKAGINGFSRDWVEPRNDAAEKRVPYSDTLTYPSDFPELADADSRYFADGVSEAKPASPADETRRVRDAASEESEELMLGGIVAESAIEPQADAPAMAEPQRMAQRARQVKPVANDGRMHGDQQPAPTDREDYAHTPDNDFIAVADAGLSTFSVDVDTASYTNVRRMLMDGQLPPADAVRVEEFVNYFDYGYAAPSLDDEHPFAASLAVSQTPWNPTTKLVRIGLKGKEIPAEQRPAMNLVFLLDVSGSMEDANKLPLVIHAMKRLASNMREQDKVAIAVYAGSSGLVLDSTSNPEEVVSALTALQAGGSTNGGAGIELAYATAEKHFIEDGVNRVILCTDGDFNVGNTNTGGLVRLAEDKAKSGVYLTVLGFGTGNLNDAMMEEISNKGEGNYAYIDSEKEAERVLVEGAGGTLQAIAKDVKIQVEFNPATIASYRLIGYENRKLADRDFNDDTKDAGDIGVGHAVTALYEIVPVGVEIADFKGQIAELEEQIKALRSVLARGLITPPGVAAMNLEIAQLQKRIDAIDKLVAGQMVDDLKYQEKPAAVESADLLTVKLRYKNPDAPKEQGTSKLIEFPLEDADVAFADTDADFHQAASAAAFGMLLRKSEYAGTANYDWVIATSPDAELKELATKAKSLK